MHEWWRKIAVVLGLKNHHWLLVSRRAAFYLWCG